MARLLILCLALWAAPALAGERGSADIEEGVDLLGQGARQILRGLVDEVEPRMRDLGRALQDLMTEGPGLDDLRQYEAPELLPNGDIIIRRRRPGSPAEGIEI